MDERFVLMAAVRRLERTGFADGHAPNTFDRLAETGGRH
jgi:hypothetical protein